MEPWGIEPQTSAQPGRPGASLDEKTAEKRDISACLSTCVQPRPEQFGQTSAIAERPIDAAIAPGDVRAHVCNSRDDMQGEDLIGTALTEAFLRAISASDFDTANRVKAKLDDWRARNT